MILTKRLAWILMIAAIAVCQTIAQVSPVSKKVEQQVIAFEQELESAKAKRDRSTLESLIAEGFTMLHSTGWLESRASWIAQAVAGAFTTQRMERHDIETQLQFFGANTAVRTTYTLLREKNEALDTWVYGKQVYVKQNSHWQCISSQSTLLFHGAIIDVDAYKPYVGTYEINPASKFTLTVEGLRLVRRRQERPESQLFMRAENEFELYTRQYITFLRDSNGVVIGAICRQNGKELWQAKKVKG